MTARPTASTRGSQVPPDVARNLEFKRYQSGHMIVLHEASRIALHDNVADRHLAEPSNS